MSMPSSWEAVRSVFWTLTNFSGPLALVPMVMPGPDKVASAPAAGAVVAVWAKATEEESAAAAARAMTLIFMMFLPFVC
ncbi:hypothetical protein D3C72_1692500 [compost metagenome]